MENIKAPRPENTLNFGQALEGIKEGKRAFRAGWNGMFIYLNKGSVARESADEKNEYTEGTRKDLFELGDTGTVTRLPNINMKAATGPTVTGWLASQTDLLAEDWNLES